MNNLIDFFLHFWNTICIKISYMDVLGLIDISAYNTDFFRRTKEKMGNKVTEDRSKEKSCFIRFLEKPFVSGIIASLIASAIWTAVQAVFVIPQSVMKTVESDNYVNKVKTAILSSDNTNNGNNTNTVNGNTSDNNNSSSNQNNNTSNFIFNVYGGIVLDKDTYSDELNNSVNAAISVEDNNVSKSKTALSDNDVIAKDINGKEYYASDLVGKQIILEYYDKEDDKNVYFQGAYNENYHWEGECVTNSYYLDDRFFGACESKFEDGVRKDYKSIVVSDKNVWSYADKECRDNGNYGVNIKYIGDTNVGISSSADSGINLFSVDMVMDKLMQYISINSYYNGITVDNMYSDNTGDAFLVKFDSQGYVSLLYQGPFSKGLMHTGNSDCLGWEIVFSEENSKYYCNEGVFINGSAKSYSPNTISVQEIRKYIQNKNTDFGVNLVWRE